jgi:rhodanese-related sulfurtransferase
MREVSHEQLCEKIDDGADFVLVDARSPMGYALSHLPGAVNLPPIWVDERAHRRIPDRAKEVVVYCEGTECETSVAVANRLIELGYSNVGHYAEGHQGWVEAGRELEGGERSAATKPS